MVARTAVDVCCVAGSDCGVLELLGTLASALETPPSSRYQHANTADTSSVIYSTDMDVEVSGTPNTRQARS